MSQKFSQNWRCCRFAKDLSFGAYELSKRALRYQQGDSNANLKILLAGGVAGVVTWASIFPLDVVKTRLQSPHMLELEWPCSAEEPLIRAARRRNVGAIQVARQVYQREGFKGFFQGLGVCSIRAFIVNAVQVSSPKLSSRKVF